ncbi:ABC transporter permease [Bacillus horti]|uniref:ABC transport system permease protein n=1 Tax=Caldalkalibacillus horti TaxID=77523 RepID=A0ABT9W2A2_9BACI|nr:ABC transporter permease [Bacillus horti]MDQ0167380.1 putative ABC transport system permease protein [Bacillus horti]
MQILKLLYRKMWNNKWLTLSLLTGLIISVALSTSIPIYTDGALKRLLDREIRDETTGLSAGAIVSRYQAVSGAPTNLEQYEAVNEFYREEIKDYFNLGIRESVQMAGLRPSQLQPVDTERINPNIRRQVSLDSYTNFADHITMVDGEVFSSTVNGGVIEAIITQQGLYDLEMRVGDEFLIQNHGGSAQPLTVRIVGAYEPNLEQTNYWYMGLSTLNTALIVHEDVIQDYVLRERQIPLGHASWYLDFNVAELTMSKASDAMNKLESLEVRSNQLLPYTQVVVTFSNLLKEYRNQGTQLQLLLFTLAAPIIVLVLYYVVMTSKQALDRQKGEIALLRSRGGSANQIFWIYLLEGLLLGGIAMLIGPFLGLTMARVIGASDGFLLFVNRQPLELNLTLTIYIYGLIAVFIALLATIIPALSAARSSIVSFKQQSARSTKKPIWQRFFLDFALLGVAGYGWYMFNERQITLVSTGLSSDQLAVHPLLFFVPSIFLFACGMILIRVFPLLMALFSKVGKRFGSVPLHITLMQVSRSSTQYNAIMLLLILTIGLGIYSSSAARTIDANNKDQMLYQYGTDVVMQGIWEQHIERPTTPPTGPPSPPGPGGPPGGGGGNPGGSGGGEQNVNATYVEPPFQIFNELPGVKHAARVYTQRGAASVGSKNLGNSMIMGIDVQDFAEVGWFKRTTLPAHQNVYLNALGQEESAVIVSQQAAERHGLSPGDSVRLTINRTSVDFVIVAVIPYWPSLYPQEMPFFIGNLNYFQDMAPLAPYEVWMSVEEGTRTSDLIEILAENNIYLAYAEDVNNEIIIQGQHPSNAGLSGILSLGFLVASAVSLAGFVLYWFFALQNRIVQFGVLRAMGISKKQLLSMLFAEQIMTAGFAVVIGVAFGQITSKLFLPFLQIGQDVSRQAPPFQVVVEQSDLNRLYVVILCMILIGLGLLVFRISQLKVHQAVKLGEER